MGCSKSKQTETEKIKPTLSIRSKEQDSKSLNGEYKVVLVGNAAVGKTSIVDKYMRGNFEENYQVTIGGNYQLKEVEYKN